MKTKVFLFAVAIFAIAMVSLSSCKYYEDYDFDTYNYYGVADSTNQGTKSTDAPDGDTPGDDDGDTSTDNGDGGGNTNVNGGGDTNANNGDGGGNNEDTPNNHGSDSIDDDGDDAQNTNDGSGENEDKYNLLKYSIKAFRESIWYANPIQLETQDSMATFGCVSTENSIPICHQIRRGPYSSLELPFYAESNGQRRKVCSLGNPPRFPILCLAISSEDSAEINPMEDRYDLFPFHGVIRICGYPCNYQDDSLLMRVLVGIGTEGIIYVLVSKSTQKEAFEYLQCFCDSDKIMNVFESRESNPTSAIRLKF